MKQNTLTEGKIYVPLIRFALPVLAALLLQSLYGAVDLLIVGQFTNAREVSAVNTGSQIMMTMTGLVASLAMGATVRIGSQIGRKDRQGAGETIGSAMVLFTVIGVGMSVLIVVAASKLAEIMMAPEEAFASTVQYIRICGAGMVAIVAYNLIGCIFRGVGDSTTPLIAVFISTVGNVFGDLVLVAGLKMGAAGAAVATVGAQVAAVIISVILMTRRKQPFDFRREMIRADRKIMRNILGIGIPVAIQDFLVGISFLVILAIVNSLGVIVSAGVGVAEKVCAFIMLVPSAFAQSLAAFVAQNYGAGKLERARRGLWYCIGTAFAIGLIMAYGSFFHGDILTGLFTKDTEVALAGWEYLKAYAIDCMLTPIFFCFIGYYNGINRTKFVMLQGIISAFLVRIPVSWIMSRQDPVSIFHIGLATPASSTLQIVMCLVFFVWVLSRADSRAEA